MDLTPQSAIDRADAAPAGAVVSCEVAIVGAGLAGAALALVLARRGVDVAVIDPFETRPPDFRCEKLGADQTALLRDLGIDDLVAQRLSPGAALTDQGFRYEALVNALRDAWPASVRFVKARVDGAVTSPDRQSLSLAIGGRVEARLAVLATGQIHQLRRVLGIERRVLRARHSLCLGFTIAPKAGGAFPFASLVRHGARAGDHVAFASLFPTPGGMRVNLFTYHDQRSPLIQAVHADPIGGLVALVPSLAGVLADAQVIAPVEIRCTDLYDVAGHVQDGVVLIGDAFGSSCPATATGVTRALNDVRQLALAHLPAWLASPGMDAGKIGQFYRDPAKTQLDALAARRAELGRATAIRTSPPWRLRRALAAARRALRRAVNRPPQPSAPIVRSQWVRVKSAAEIAATLDGAGALDGLPFMPEMAAHCGAVLRVHRRADRTCVEGQGIRRMDDTLLLEATRCDGAAHDGCQRNCMMFWKEAWLTPVAGPDDVAPPPVDGAALLKLQALPTRDGELYQCQSTALLAATRPSPRRDAPQLLRELRLGELSPRLFAAMFLRAGLNRLRRALGQPDLGVVIGRAEKPRRGGLDLRPGERVRIKRRPALRKVLTPDARNAGLTFEPEMAARAGETHQVDYLVEKMIHEETGRMVGLTRTVVLKDVNCGGTCARNCPRSNPLFWRESWLERVAPET